MSAICSILNHFKIFEADEMKKKKTDRNTVVGLVGCRADVYQSFHSQSEKWDEKHFQMLKVGPRNSYSSFDFKRSW